MTAILGRGALLSLLLCVTANGADWPQWLGPARDGHVPADVPVPLNLPPSPKVVWHIPIGYGVASPIVAAGKVIYQDNTSNKESLHLADAATGQELWSATVDDVQKDFQSEPGPRCTPLTDGQRVYAQSCRGQLNCFSFIDGKEIWGTNYVKNLGAVFIGEKGRAEGASRHGNAASPLLDGEHLIAEAGGVRGAGVVCFDKRTGGIIWKSQNDTPAYAAPLIADIAGTRQLICFMAHDVIALDPAAGRLLWRIPVKTALGRHAMTPVVVGDIVIVSSFQAGLIGIKVARDGDGFKAQRIWTQLDSATNFSCPVAVGDFLYGLGPDKNLVCVDIRTGKQAWSQEGYFLAADPIHSHAGMIAMGQSVLTLTDSGELVFFAADPMQFRQISRIQACGKNWCNPAFSDGRLFLRDERELRCIQLMQ